MRMVLEGVMLLTLIGGLFFIMQVLAKERRQEKPMYDADDSDDRRTLSKSE